MRYHTVIPQIDDTLLKTKLMQLNLGLITKILKANESNVGFNELPKESLYEIWITVQIRKETGEPG